MEWAALAPLLRGMEFIGALGVETPLVTVKKGRR